jgi:hypothetical protein
MDCPKNKLPCPADEEWSYTCRHGCEEDMNFASQLDESIERRIEHDRKYTPGRGYDHPDFRP